MNNTSFRFAGLMVGGLAMLVIAAISAMAASGIRQVRAAEFDSVVIETSWEFPVVVEFYSERCRDCRRFEPVLRSLEKDYRGRLVFVRVDVDKDSAIAAEFGLRSMPTVVVFAGGEALDRVDGATSKRALREVLDFHTAVGC